jgi:hypothetical protein
MTQKQALDGGDQEIPDDGYNSDESFSQDFYNITHQSTIPGKSKDQQPLSNFLTLED